MVGAVLVHLLERSGQDRLESDQHADQPARGCQIEQLRILGDVDRYLADPLLAQGREGPEEVPRVLAVDEDVVVDEEEGPAAHRRDLGGDVVDRAPAVLRVHRGDRAEAAAVRTAARGLDEVPDDVAPPFQERAIDLGEVREIGVVPADVAGCERAAGEVVEQRRPGVVGLPHHDRVGVCRRLVGQERRVPAAEDDGDPARAKGVGQLVGAHGAHRADAYADQVDRTRQVDLTVVVVGDRDAPRRRRERREIGQGERRHQALVHGEVAGSWPDEQQPHTGELPDSFDYADCTPEVQATCRAA